MQVGIRIEESWPQFVTVSMVGGTIRRKVIHRESFQSSVLNLLWQQRGAHRIEERNCLLTTPSLLSKATRLEREHRKVETRTLENDKRAARRFVLTYHLWAARPVSPRWKNRESSLLAEPTLVVRFQLGRQSELR
jgi:hypothetical protein